MTSTKSISFDSENAQWLEKNLGRGKISQFVNDLVTRERELRTNPTIEILEKEHERIEKIFEENKRRLNELDEEILKKIKEAKEKAEELAKEREETLKKRKAEKEAKEREIIQAISQLKGIEEIKEANLEAVDRLRNLNPGKEKIIDTWHLKLYLKKK